MICHQTTRKVLTPGVVVTCGAMEESFIVECTAGHVGDVDLNKEVIDVGFSVSGIGYIPNDNDI